MAKREYLTTKQVCKELDITPVTLKRLFKHKLISPGACRLNATGAVLWDWHEVKLVLDSLLL